MTGLKKDLAGVVKSLKALTKKTEKMKKKLRAVEKAQAKAMAKKSPSLVGRPRKKSAGAGVPGRRASKTTAVTAVFAVIKRSRKGVTTEQIMKNTGFDEKKVWNVINRLKSQGMVKSAQRGIYVKI
jgi:hypothetical protein